MNILNYYGLNLQVLAGDGARGNSKDKVNYYVETMLAEEARQKVSTLKVDVTASMN